MQVVRLGPLDLATLRKTLADEQLPDSVLIGIDDQGLKVRDDWRWSAPLGEVQP